MSANLTCYGRANESSSSHGDEKDSIGGSKVIHAHNPAADFTQHWPKRSGREPKQQHQHHKVDEIRTQSTEGDSKPGRGVT